MKSWPLRVIVMTYVLWCLTISAAFASGAPVYGTLENAPDDASFTVYKDQANPPQILTQDNLGGGYSKPEWQLDTTNFSPQYDTGTAMRVVFSDTGNPPRFWEKNFDNPDQTTNLGQVAEGAPLSDNECPAPTMTIEPAGNNQLRISWTPQSGVAYNLYRTNTGTNPVGNGRYDLLQASATSPYIDTTPNTTQNWYLLVPVDSNSKPLGCFSVSHGYKANVVTLSSFTASAKSIHTIVWMAFAAMCLIAAGLYTTRKIRG